MNQAQAVLDQAIAELQRLRPELRRIAMTVTCAAACKLISDFPLVHVESKAEVIKEERFGGMI